MINSVVGHGHGTVPALVAHLETEIYDVLLAELDVVRDPPAVDHIAPAALVQAKLGVDQVTPILQQPLHAVVWAAALFVGSQRHDDVAIRLETLAPIADQVCDPDRSLRLVVSGTATVELAVLLDELGTDPSSSPPVWPRRHPC